MTQKDLQRYQWIKGDNLGEVEIMDAKNPKDGDFILFESGNRCNESLLEEFVIPIYSEDDILPLGINEIEAKPPAKIRIGNLKTAPRVKKAGVISDPIISLLDKSKKSKVKLNVRFDLSLPNKDFLNVINESFDEDIIKALSSYIVSNIKNPEQFLSKKVESSIKEWFSKK